MELSEKKVKLPVDADLADYNLDAAEPPVARTALSSTKASHAAPTDASGEGGDVAPIALKENVQIAVRQLPLLGNRDFTLVLCTSRDDTVEASDAAFAAYQASSDVLRQHTTVHNLRRDERPPACFEYPLPVVFIRANGGLIYSVARICDFFARFVPRLKVHTALRTASRSGYGGLHARERGRRLARAIGAAQSSGDVVDGVSHREAGAFGARADGKTPGGTDAVRLTLSAPSNHGALLERARRHAAAVVADRSASDGGRSATTTARAVDSGFSM